MPFHNTLRADGVHDDTAALQERLDAGGLVEIPAGSYLISDTLLIHDGTDLRLDFGAVIRLADSACCLMLRNALPGAREPGRGIIVEGGVWDGNNAAQRRGKVSSDKPYYSGVVMRFERVTGLTVRDMTVKDPESYAMQLKDVDRFRVENITFDFNMLKPNMDGVHVQGRARNGVVRNIMGATNDDLVALNCDDGYDDGENPIVTQGDIENVLIDGVFADNGYTAVRLLSCGSRMRNIAIRNIFGTYRFYGVSFTNHGIIPDTPSWFDGVMIDGVHASKHPQIPPVDRRYIDSVDIPYGRGTHDDAIRHGPIIWFERGIACGDVSISNVFRIEEAVTQAPTIQIDEDVRIERLALHNVNQRFLNVPEAPLIDNRGAVKEIAES